MSASHEMEHQPYGYMSRSAKYIDTFPTGLGNQSLPFSVAGSPTNGSYPPNVTFERGPLELLSTEIRPNFHRQPAKSNSASNFAQPAYVNENVCDMGQHRSMSQINGSTASFHQKPHLDPHHESMEVSSGKKRKLAASKRTEQSCDNKESHKRMKQPSDQNPLEATNGYVNSVVSAMCALIATRYDYSMPSAQMIRSLSIGVNVPEDRMGRLLRRHCGPDKKTSRRQYRSCHPNNLPVHGIRTLSSAMSSCAHAVQQLCDLQLPGPSIDADEQGKHKRQIKKPMTARGTRFPCTHGHAKMFGSKSMWKRHEETHCRQRMWLCKYDRCQSKPEDERSYSRPEHLRDHLSQKHPNVPYSKSKISSCALDLSPEFDRRCLFRVCGVTFDDWKSRCDHLADHFSRSWKPDDWRASERPSDTVVYPSSDAEAESSKDSETEHIDTTSDHSTSEEDEDDDDDNEAGGAAGGLGGDFDHSSNINFGSQYPYTYGSGGDQNLSTFNQTTDFSNIWTLQAQSSTDIIHQNATNSEDRSQHQARDDFALKTDTILSSCAENRCAASIVEQKCVAASCTRGKNPKASEIDKPLESLDSKNSSPKHKPEEFAGSDVDKSENKSHSNPRTKPEMSIADDYSGDPCELMTPETQPPSPPSATSEPQTYLPESQESHHPYITVLEAISGNNEPVRGRPDQPINDLRTNRAKPLVEAPSSIRSGYSGMRHSVASKHSLASMGDSLPPMINDHASATSSSESLDPNDINTGSLLQPDHHGVLEIPPHPEVSFFACPFQALGCEVLHSSRGLEEWVSHSLLHFSLEQDGCRRKIKPPETNPCPYCSKIFQAEDAVVSWRSKLLHIAEHHASGITVPDFGLFRYLWEQKIIRTSEFRDIWGPSDRFKSMTNTRGKAETTQVEQATRLHEDSSEIGSPNRSTESTRAPLPSSQSLVPIR